MTEPKKSRSNKKKALSQVVEELKVGNPVRAGDLNVDMVKEMFMKSEFVEWAPFCASMKWNHNSTRLKYPVATWVREKKELLATIQAEEIGDAIFRHKPQWHKDVLKVLKNAPALVEQIDAIYKFRVNQITRMINRDVEKKQKALLENNNDYDEIAESEFYKKIKQSDIESMARTADIMVQAMQRAVLINNWSVNVAEEFSKPETIMNEQESQGLTLQVIGHEKVTSDDLERWAKKYYDPPQLPALPKDDDANS